MVVLEENIDARVKCHVGFSDSLNLKDVCMNMIRLLKGSSWWCYKETMVPLSPPPPSGFRQDCMTT